jgi:hypothetical protein
MPSQSGVTLPRGRLILGLEVTGSSRSNGGIARDLPACSEKVAPGGRLDMYLVYHRHERNGCRAASSLRN